MPKVSNKSWQEIKDYERYCRDCLYELTDASEDCDETKIKQSQIHLAYNLRRYKATLAVALRRYELNEQLESLKSKWPPNDAPLMVAPYENHGDVRFCDSEWLNLLSDLQDAVEIAHESDLSAEESAEEKRTKDRDHNSGLEKRRNLLQFLSATIAVATTFAAGAVSKCEIGSDVPKPAAVRGAVASGFRAPVSITCSPNVEGLFAVSTASNYVVQTNGKVALPIHVVCTIKGIDGQKSEQVLITIEEGVNRTGPSFSLSADATSVVTLTSQASPKCLDLDQDGFGDNCEMGPDCDDADPNNHTDNGCLNCADVDDDNYWVGCDTFDKAKRGPDCNDADFNVLTDAGCANIDGF